MQINIRAARIERLWLFQFPFSYITFIFLALFIVTDCAFSCIEANFAYTRVYIGEARSRGGNIKRKYRVLASIFGVRRNSGTVKVFGWAVFLFLIGTRSYAKYGLIKLIYPALELKAAIVDRFL